MSMTREEAIEYAESKKMRLEALVYSDDCKYGNYAMYSGELSFVNAARSALRPVSREQVEKVWRGKWKISDYGYFCSRCGTGLEDYYIRRFKFCPFCSAPMTDEAVQMVMERINKMEETENGLG